MSDRLSDEQVADLAKNHHDFVKQSLAREVQETRPELERLRAEVARLTAERDRLIDAINTPSPGATDGK